MAWSAKNFRENRLLATVLIAAGCVCAGCYQRVVRAEGMDADRYTIHETAEESELTFFPRDEKDKPERVRPRSEGIR